MNDNKRDLFMVIIHMCKQSTDFIKCRRFPCLCLLLSVVFAPPCLGTNITSSEAPVSEETLQAAANGLNWTVNSDDTQLCSENHLIYTLETGDQMRISVSSALIDNKHFLTVTCINPQLPEKPTFILEDWKEVLVFAEMLYHGSSGNELYQTMAEQEITNTIPTQGDSTPAGYETIDWDAELQYGYAKVHWAISSGTVEHYFPSPVIQDWRITFSISLYESKAAYESIHSDS